MPRVAMLVLAFPILVALGLLTMPILIVVGGIAHDLRTDAASDTPSCETALTTSCSFALAQAHMHFDTSNMTVTETSPGSEDRTSASTLDRDDRVTVTVTGLTASTTYNFAVAYVVRGTNVSADMADALNWGPPALFFGVLVVTGVAGVMALSAASSIGGRWLLLGFGVYIIALLFLFLPVINGVATGLAGDSTLPGVTGLFRVAPAFLTVLFLGLAVYAGLRAVKNG